MRANETCSEAKCQFAVGNRDVLMNAQSPHKWWSTLKSAVFSSSSSLPPLVGGGGGLVYESGVKPDLLKRTADVLAPRLSVVFRRLLRLTSFPTCWRQANVTPITKGPPFSSVANYRPISLGC